MVNLKEELKKSGEKFSESLISKDIIRDWAEIDRISAGSKRQIGKWGMSEPRWWYYMIHEIFDFIYPHSPTEIRWFYYNRKGPKNALIKSCCI